MLSSLEKDGRLSVGTGGGWRRGGGALLVLVVVLVLVLVNGEKLPGARWARAGCIVPLSQSLVIAHSAI